VLWTELSEDATILQKAKIHRFCGNYFPANVSNSCSFLYEYFLVFCVVLSRVYLHHIRFDIIPVSPKAKAGLRATPLRPSVCLSVHLQQYRGYLLCVIWNSKSFHSSPLKHGTLIAHLSKMFTSYLKQIWVMLFICLTFYKILIFFVLSYKAENII
jgi:hypothetical protein